MKKLLFGLLLFAGLGASPALAGSGTFPLTPCTSGCTNQGITTDGSSNIYPNAAIVDGTAAANKAGVDSSGGLTVKGEGTAGTPAGGVLTIQGGSGGTAVPISASALPLPTGAMGSTGGTVGLVAGSAIVGNVRIDQTTPGTTAAVSLSYVNGNNAAAAATGVLKVGVVGGNSGNVIDFAGQNASSPPASILIGGQFNTTPTTITTGNSSPLQLDNAGNLLVNIKAGAGSGGTALGDNAAWTAGTTNFTPSGCEFTTGGATAITTGHAATVGCTIRREQFADIEAVGGTASFANYGSTPGAVPSLPVNAFVTNTNANGQATAANSSPVVLPAAQVTADPCSLNTKVNVAISTATGTTQLVAPSGSTQVYICSIFTVGGTASIQNIVGGTGATCTTGTPVALAGSTTAANGMSFAANGGFTFGNGGGTVMRTTTAGHGVCLIQSATAQISGNITYVQQ